MSDLLPLCIIDGDSICYICSSDNIEDTLNKTDSLIKNILNINKSNHYYIFLSIGKYYRHIVNPEYKGNRNTSSLKYIRTIKRYLIEEYSAIAVDRLEADDLVAYVACNIDYGSKYAPIICSPDKDVRKQVPGKHFDYKYFKFGHTTQEEAYRFLYKQILQGDPVDNIKGIPRIGDKKSDKILKGVKPEHYKHIVINEYIKYYENELIAIDEFMKTYKQAYLLRTKEDYISIIGEEPVIPDPIEFNLF